MKTSRFALFKIILLIFQEIQATADPFLSMSNSYLLKAEELTHWKLYEDALSLYQNSIDELDKNKDPIKEFSTIRIVETLLKNGQFQKALEALKDFEIDSEKGKDWIIFLKALSLRRIKKHQLAEELIKDYFFKSSQKNEILILELAIILFEKKKYSDALNQLDTLDVTATNENVRILSDIYRIKIAHLQENYILAQNILNHISLNPEVMKNFFEEISILKANNAFFLKNYIDAISYYENALNQKESIVEKWIPEAILNVSKCYSKIYENKGLISNLLLERLEKGEIFLIDLQKKNYSDESCLAVAEMFLLKADLFNDAEARKRCEEVLKNGSPKIQFEALLIKAQLATTFQEKELFLKSLVGPKNVNEKNYVIAWLLRALNFRNEANRSAELSIKQTLSNESKRSLNKAIDSLKEGSPYDENSIQRLVEIAIEFQSIKELTEAYTFIGSLINSQILMSKNLYLSAQIASSLFQLTDDKNYLQSAIENLQLSLSINSNDKNRHLFSLLLSKLQITLGNNNEAVPILEKIVSENLEQSLTSEALFLLAKITPSQAEKQKYYQKIFLDDPKSPFAGEAYFRFFDQTQYIQGEKEAIAHLKKFLKNFQNSAFTINSLYLLGLDSKRNRKNSKGKWISKKNLIESIDHFQQLESRFEYLSQNNLIPLEQTDYYRGIFYRAILERGDANQEIGIESLDAKKQIYLKYAVEVFDSLISLIEKNQDSEFFQSIYFESHVRLANTHYESHFFNEAENVLNNLILKSNQAGITKGYYLSRGWNLLGKIAYVTKNYTLALERFDKAEEASKGRVLNTDQKLDQWIQISKCYKHLNKYDQAMSQLSKIINADAISGLRIKAMVLRSEIYSLQGRDELARKQLEAAALKGGEWGKKAKELLEKNYGYR